MSRSVKFARLALLAVLVCPCLSQGTCMDLCPDVAELPKTVAYNSSLTCQCDSLCESHGDCCADRAVWCRRAERTDCVGQVNEFCAANLLGDCVRLSVRICAGKHNLQMLGNTFTAYRSTSAPMFRVEQTGSDAPARLSPLQVSGKSSVHRSGDNKASAGGELSGTAMAENLIAGDVYSLVMMAYDAPWACTSSPCSFPLDFRMAPARPHLVVVGGFVADSRGTGTAAWAWTKEEETNAAGAPPSGAAVATARHPVGDPYIDVMAAEVQLWLRHRGPAAQTYQEVQQQMLTFDQECLDGSSNTQAGRRLLSSSGSSTIAAQEAKDAVLPTGARGSGGRALAQAVVECGMVLQSVHLSTSSLGCAKPWLTQCEDPVAASCEAQNVA